LNSKIKSLEELQPICVQLKSEGKKIVQCHGVFDLLHIGHIKHFKEAKEFGDVLIVSITPDEHVNKGPNRPAFSTNLRLEAIASLQVVDFVVSNQWPFAIEIIKILKPSIYCKGPDYKNHSDDITGKINDEEQAIKSVGGKIEYTSDITFSSSNLLNNYGDINNKSQKLFLDKVIKSQNLNGLIKKIEGLKDLNVLIIGETIIDKYIFCEALGKSGKEPVLVLRDLEMEQYIGGAAAIARHLSDFCQNITLLSMLGEKKEYESYINNNLSENISTTFIYKSDSPTITKRRYVDYISKAKTLGVYSINDMHLDDQNEKKFINFIDDLIPKHDLVIVSDYGHGFISQKVASHISSQSLFTTINAQINAANIGYHTMNNYNNVNCAIINESELRHELRDRYSSVETLMGKLVDKLLVDFLIVTRGSDGATLYDSTNKVYYNCPAFARKVVDKIGSGDAMLAIISCCLKSGMNPELSLFIGSLAAAQSVEVISNSIPVSKIQLLKTVEHLLK